MKFQFKLSILLISQSEEDIQLRNQLEMLLERLKVCQASSKTKFNNT